MWSSSVRRIAIVAVGIGLTAASTPGAQTRYTRTQEQEFHEATSAAIAHGDYDEASELAGARADDDPSAAAVRARLLVLAGELDSAETLIAPVAEAQPFSAAGLEYAQLLAATGRRDQAVPYFRAVADAGTVSRQALDLFRAGLAASALGRYRDANTLLRGAALASESDPAMQTAWGELFLEKYNQADALQSFNQALESDEEWAPAHLGLARSLTNDNPPLARSSADRALEIDPNFVAAHLFIAELELGDRNTEAARAALERALAVNPNSLAARAMSAAMAYLEDRIEDFDAEVASALQINPAYGDIYRVAGNHVARAYRFPEAVTLVRRALELDPDNVRAHAELGMHLLRTGDEPGARVALERSFADDPFDLVTYNLLSLMDTLDEFETFERGDVIARLHPDEADVLGEYVLTMAQEAIDELSERYQMEVRPPILVEMFPTHDDFAVRTLGLPGFLGALGACFGSVVTLDSPRALPPGDFNWRATLWHEMAHVVTLQMSEQRLPRWLSEGISTYEEKRKRLEWGRDEVLNFARALNDDAILPLRDLNSGFSRPDAISMSYFQASVLVEHIVDAYGEEALRTLVRSYADGLDTEGALQRIDLDFDVLQASFDAAVDEEFGALRRALQPVGTGDGAATAAVDDDSDGPHIEILGADRDSDPGDDIDSLRAVADANPDRYQVQFALGMALRAVGEFDEALTVLERAAELAPAATGIRSPRGVMASIAQELGDNERAMVELERLLIHDATSLDAVRDLAALAEEAGDERRQALAYDRLIGIDPFDPVAHQAIGRMAMQQGEMETAIRELRIALAAGPVDRVGTHSDLAESYLNAGDFDAAKVEALNALEMAPTYERAQELLLRVIEEQP